MAGRVIDARSGEELEVGDIVEYGGGEWVQLVELEERFFSAQGLLRGTNPVGGEIVEAWVDLPVRFTHPDFFLRRVVFLPT